MSDNTDNRFIFVIWSAVRHFEQQIIGEIGRRFNIIRTFEVVWSKRHFTQNLAAFYGWKGWFCWWNKARKCGKGPFLVIEVEDPAPMWQQIRDTSGHLLTCDKNIYALKQFLRKLTGHSNRIHSSVSPEETKHQLAALNSKEEPIPFRRMQYADAANGAEDQRT